MSHMLSCHQNVNDVTKRANVSLLLHAASEVPCSHSFFINFLQSVYKNEFQAIFQLQTQFSTIIIPIKHAGSIRFYYDDSNRSCVSGVMADALE